MAKARADKREFQTNYFERVGGGEQLALILGQTRYSRPRNLHFGFSIEDVPNKTVYFYTKKGTLYDKRELKESKS